MTLITLGPEGTFSHQLAQKVAGKTGETLRLVPTIHSILSAVAKGEGDGIVPMENSEAGSVGETLDGLTRFPLTITAEMYMPIHHNLASHEPLHRIQVIYAHPQTHEQCSECIETWKVPVIHTSSNAASALEARKTPHAAAILSESASAIYGMPIIVRNTENNKNNTTRFVRISTVPARDGRPEKCSILIDPSTDRAGLLHDLLHVFAERNVNLTRIESRPSKRGIGNYLFFLDYAWSERTAEALDELRKITEVKELGCYRKYEVAE
jgi:prephenate dehydratase